MEEGTFGRSLVRVTPINLPVERKDDGDFVTKEFQLVFDVNAGCEIEQRTGRNLCTEAGWKRWDLKDLSVALWAGLQELHPDLTLKDVRRMMNGVSAAEVLKAIDASWIANRPKIEKDKKQDPTEPAAK